MVGGLSERLVGVVETSLSKSTSGTFLKHSEPEDV